MASRSTIAFALVFALWIVGCDSGEDRLDPAFAVTGFVITTASSPEADLSYHCGKPTRTSGRITAVPNPYFGSSPYEASDENRILRFINLPTQVRIEIVRAYWADAGGPVDPRGAVGETVRVFEKDSPNRSYDWDLRDASGNLVPSGFYRVFFTVSEEVAEGSGFDTTTVFDDLYVVQREVSTFLGDGSWVDPTGCIR